MPKMGNSARRLNCPDGRHETLALPRGDPRNPSVMQVPILYSKNRDLSTEKAGKQTPGKH